MGLAVVSLIVLVVLGAVAGLVLARVFAAAGARNERRPGADEGDRGQDGGRVSAAGKRQAAVVFGVAVAALGVLMGLLGAASAFSSYSLLNAVPAASIGILLGAASYFLGARRLGTVATVLSAAALLFGVAVSQGLVPGMEPTDHGLPAQEPRAED